MENNTIRPASEQQINYLKRLGYKGNVEGLTNAEASALIQQLNQQRNSAYESSGYESPNYPQSQAPQQQVYQQPVQQPQQKKMPLVKPMNCNIETRDGESLILDKQTVDDYICKNMTESEYRYFFSICKGLKLNPFLKDVYAIKYGNSPAQFVIDYKVLQQSADENPKFDGMEHGIIVCNENGLTQEVDREFLLPNEQLVGAWCKVYRKDRTRPTKATAGFTEVCKYKDGMPSGTWKEKPIFMNIKVAKAWALREAFPNMFSNNTYTSDEIEVIDNVPSNSSVEVEQKRRTASVVPPSNEEEFNV